MSHDASSERTFPDAAAMDDLIGLITGTLPPGMAELLSGVGLDFEGTLRFQPLAELFALAREARGWTPNRAAKLAGVRLGVLKDFEAGNFGEPVPWLVPYAVKVGMTTLLGEWIAANPRQAAQLDLPAPDQLAAVFGAVMRAEAEEMTLLPDGMDVPRVPMFAAPPGFAQRFDPVQLQATLELALKENPLPTMDALLNELLLADEPVPAEFVMLPRVAGTGTAAAYQFKVTLRYIRPAIWRRIVVPADLTFAQLHDVLQVVMGWTNSHLHEFEYRRQVIGKPDREWARPMLHEGKTRLCDLSLKPRAKLLYHYDFGDDWEHDVVLEKILPAEAAPSPRCLAGQRACPPEDCGSVPGYERLCELFANPKLKDPDGLREWIGGSFDAEAFDPEMADAYLGTLTQHWQRQAAKKQKAKVKRGKKQP